MQPIAFIEDTGAHEYWRHSPITKPMPVPHTSPSVAEIAFVLLTEIIQEIIKISCVLAKKNQLFQV